MKWSVEPARAEDVPAAIARAYYTSMQAPRGPTLVSIPVDDWDRLCAPLETRTVSQSVAGDAALLMQAAAVLARARRPVIVVGAGVARDDAWTETIALAERHQAAVWVSPMSSRNSFPEDHRLFAGFLAADRERIVQSLAGADLILVLGAPAFTYHVEGVGPHIPAGAELIQLVDNPSIAAWTPVGVSIVTHLKLGVQALLAGAGAVCTQRTASGAAAAATRRSATDRQLPAATDRDAEAQGQRRRRGGTQQPRPDARLPADHRIPMASIPARAADSATVCPRPSVLRSVARTRKSSRTLATARACTRSRDSGRRRSSG